MLICGPMKHCARERSSGVQNNLIIKGTENARPIIDTHSISLAALQGGRIFIVTKLPIAKSILVNLTHDYRTKVQPTEICCY